MYYKNYRKEEIVNKIYESAIKYRENLLNKNIIYIYEKNKAKELNFIETIFNDYNFLHFTGTQYRYNAHKFFKDCLEKKLSCNNIKVNNNSFTHLKLEVLENAMSINKSAKRIGDFNGSKVNIKIEKVIGNTHLCLGFSNLDSKNKKLRFYYPKTLLQDNLKNNIIEDNRIIAILSKSKEEKMYKEVTYLSKNINLNCLKESCMFKNLIDFENIYSLNLVYQKKINKIRQVAK